MISHFLFLVEWMHRVTDFERSQESRRPGPFLHHPLLQPVLGLSSVGSVVRAVWWGQSKWSVPWRLNGEIHIFCWFYHYIRQLSLLSTTSLHFVGSIMFYLHIFIHNKQTKQKNTVSPLLERRPATFLMVTRSGQHTKNAENPFGKWSTFMVCISHLRLEEDQSPK